MNASSHSTSPSSIPCVEHSGYSDSERSTEGDVTSESDDPGIELWDKSDSEANEESDVALGTGHQFIYGITLFLTALQLFLDFLKRQCRTCWPFYRYFSKTSLRKLSTL